jgi:hypothetical protein
MRLCTCCAAAVCCRSLGLSGTILRSNMHESRALLQLPHVLHAVQHEDLIIWPWVSGLGAAVMQHTTDTHTHTTNTHTGFFARVSETAVAA